MKHRTRVLSHVLGFGFKYTIYTLHYRGAKKPSNWRMKLSKGWHWDFSQNYLFLWKLDGIPFNLRVKSNTTPNTQRSPWWKFHWVTKPSLAFILLYPGFPDNGFIQVLLMLHTRILKARKTKPFILRWKTAVNLVFLLQSRDKRN